MLRSSPSERTQIEAAVAAAEKRISARIAVAIAHRADDYAAYPMLAAAILALIVGDVVALACSDLRTWWIVVVQAALFIVADLVFHLRAVALLVGAAARARKVTRTNWRGSNSRRWCTTTRPAMPGCCCFSPRPSAMLKYCQAPRSRRA